MHFYRRGSLCSKIFKKNKPWIKIFMSSKRAHEFINLVIGEGSVIEGSAKISLPYGEVFYNPVQQFNRDLSISAISVFEKQRALETKDVL